MLLFVTNKLDSLMVYSPHMIHILNLHDPRSALVHNSFALTVCLEVTLTFELTTGRRIY